MQIQHTPLHTELGRSLRVFCLFSVLSVLSCAKVGEPLPPIVQNPPGIQNLQIEQITAATRLIFSIPGSGVEWVEVYRHCNPQAPVGRFQVIAQIGQDQLIRHSKPGSFRFEDRSRDRNPMCRYTVRLVDRNGQKSDHSNIVSLEQPPPTPASG
jgi:hypothetical protein